VTDLGNRYQMIARRILVVTPIWALVTLAGPVSMAAGEPAPGKAAADLLAAATEAFSTLHYDDALRLADQAWQSGASDPVQIRQIFALAGLAAGSIDDQSAPLWFRRWLYLEPTATLPDGTSPKLTALLDDARNALAGTAITARTAVHPDTVTVTVPADPLGLVAAARIGGIRVALRDHAASLAAPVARSEVELLDRYGNLLLVITVVPQGPAPVPAAVPGPPPWFARWTTWGIASGVLAVLGGGATWVAIDARSTINRRNLDSANLDYSEVAPLDRRFHDARLASGIAFTGAGITALAAIVLGLRGRGEPHVQVSTTGESVVWTFAF
jgi:hypothetical protein